MKKGAGFTLLEILVVLGILSLLAAWALPRYGGVYGQYRLYEAARQMALDLKLAREKSLEGSATCRVEVDAGGYTVFVPLDPVSSADTYSTRRVDFPAGVTCQGPPQVSFDYLGSPDPAPAGFVLIDRAGRACRVAVEAVTGKVSVDFGP